VLLFYTKSDENTFNRDSIRVPYDEETLARSNRNPGIKSVMGTKGKDRLNPLGKIPESWWNIPMLQGNSLERLGYPTQKPIALLERIILASSNPGDTVLDPFSGCGTAISAAHKLGRRWIGIDITHLAIGMHKNRLKEHFGLIPKRDYDVFGEPTDMAGALQLSLDDRYQFQWWALGLINARAEGASGDSKVGKKGSDKGIDGSITFMDEATKKVKRVIISVKSGNVNSAMVRDLRGVIERETDSPIGIFITLLEPSSEMKKEAIIAGTYLSPLWQKKYPRLQIFTIQGLLNGAKPDIPPDYKTFKQAERISTETSSQPELKLE
jgi:site-specific DNA-methyltransferase (adenine-specific)